MALIVDMEKRYGPFHLRVAFSADCGITGLLGASGAGKSLTLRCIAGIETPDTGHIELDGRVLFDKRRRINLPPQRRGVGYLFQSCALFPRMTTEENLKAGFQSGRGSVQAVSRLIAAFGLEECRGKYPGQLSGGQQQRLALARILAGEPKALLLDEPFSALDSYLKWQMELEMTRRLEQFPGPTLLVSHDREEVYRHCRRVCVLAHGSSQPVVETGQLFSTPSTLSACRLAGWENLSRARLTQEGEVEAIDWGMCLTPPQPLPKDVRFLGIRAHQMRPAQGPGTNRAHCRVLCAVEERLSVTLLLSPSGGHPAGIPLRMEWEKDRLPSGGLPDALWVEFPPRALLLLSQP